MKPGPGPSARCDSPPQAPRPTPPACSVSIGLHVFGTSVALGLHSIELIVVDSLSSCICGIIHVHGFVLVRHQFTGGGADIVIGLWYCVVL